MQKFGEKLSQKICSLESTQNWLNISEESTGSLNDIHVDNCLWLFCDVPTDTTVEGTMKNDWVVCCKLKKWCKMKTNYKNKTIQTNYSFIQDGCLGYKTKRCTLCILWTLLKSLTMLRTTTRHCHFTVSYVWISPITKLGMSLTTIKSEVIQRLIRTKAPAKRSQHANTTCRNIVGRNMLRAFGHLDQFQTWANN